ncbi:MAG: response regulator [Paracoccaceae bacterium]|nr:MAG: response regulator [Paracoccaceae bacterium]
MFGLQHRAAVVLTLAGSCCATQGRPLATDGKMADASPGVSDPAASRLRRIPFRVYVALRMVPVLVALAVALGFVAWIVTDEAADRTARTAFDGKSELALAEVARLYESARAAAAALSLHPAIVNGTDANDHDALQELATLLVASPALEAAYVGWPNGDFTLLRHMRGRHSTFDAPLQAMWLAQLVSGGRSRFEFLDEALVVVEFRDDVDYPIDPSQRPWHREALLTEDAILTEPYLFFTTGEPGVSAARRATSGAVAGVDLSLRDLSSRLSALSLPEGGEAALVTSGGNVLADADTARIMAVIENADRPAKVLPNLADLGDSVIAAIAQQSALPYYGEIMHGGRHWIVQMSDVDQRDLRLAMAIPVSSLSGASGTLGSTFIGLFILVSIATLATVWAVANRIGRRLASFALEAERTAQLRFGHAALSDDGIAEFARLGATLTTMSGSLSAMARIGEIVARTDAPDTLLPEIVEVLADWTGAQSGVIRLGDPAKTGPMDTVAQFGPVPSPEQLGAPVQDHLQDSAADARTTLAGRLTQPILDGAGATLGMIDLRTEDPRAAFSPAARAAAAYAARSIGLAVDRHRMAEAWSNDRREASTVFASVADGIFILDLDGHIRAQNAAAADVLGWTDEEVFGRPAHETLSGRNAEGTLYTASDCPIGQTLRDGETRRIAGDSFSDRNGRQIPVDYACSPLRGDDGTVTGAVLSFRDVSDRRRAEAQLIERIKELRCLYSVVALLQGAPGTATDNFPAMAELLVQSVQHVRLAVARLNVEGIEYRSANWSPPVITLHADIGDKGRNGFVEIGYVEMPPPSIVGDAGFLDEEHNMLSVVASHIARMLERRDMRERLNQTERLRAVGELTGGIAHDFNNLLTIIVGGAETLEERLAHDDDARRIAVMIHQAGMNGAELTRGLLAFSRKQSLAPKPVAVDALIGAMSAMVERTIGEHLRYVTHFEPGLLLALADPAQLESAILNLVINARDAMPDGGLLTVEVANTWLDETFAASNDEVTPGPYVMIAVTDTGIGMSPELVARAFEPFFTTKSLGHGTGLGLSMVWGFAKQSRGHVRIYSEPGEGTTVKLFLPCADPAEEQSVVVPPPRQDSARGSRILLVEDDSLVREHATMVLQGLGFQVDAHADGPSAINAVREGLEFDVLFTDMVMPGGMNGRELAIAIRELKPDMRVVFTSGYADKAIIRQSRLEAGSLFISKPYRRADLADVMRRALG